MFPKCVTEAEKSSTEHVWCARRLNVSARMNGTAQTTGKTIKTTLHIREMIKKRTNGEKERDQVRGTYRVSFKKRTIPSEREWKTRRTDRVTVICTLLFLFFDCQYTFFYYYFVLFPPSYWSYYYFCYFIRLSRPVCGSGGVDSFWFFVARSFCRDECSEVPNYCGLDYLLALFCTIGLSFRYLRCYLHNIHYFETF